MGRGIEGGSNESFGPGINTSTPMSISSMEGGIGPLDDDEDEDEENVEVEVCRGEPRGDVLLLLDSESPPLLELLVILLLDTR